MSIFKILLTFAPLALDAVIAAEPYGEQPLRSNLSPLSYFSTEGSREGHRFSNEAVNRYRLYDFYARQAAYHLGNPADPSKLLPPFPGLDGGRRGHWGVTNEKSTTAFIRDRAPDFTSVTIRNGDGELKLLSGSREHPAVMVYDTLRPGLKAVYPDGTLEAPEHAFDQGVNRFGLAMRVKGEERLRGANPEWMKDGKPVGRFDGYHLHRESVVLRVELGSGRLLEQASVTRSPDGKLSCLVRNFEFLNEVPASLEFRLPAGLGPSSAVGKPATLEQAAGQGFIRLDRDGNSIRHLIATTGTMHPGLTPDGTTLELSDIHPSDRLIVATWSGATADAVDAENCLKNEVSRANATRLSTLIDGGPSRFPETMTVAGKMNADPAASGGAYEIDDIPVPSENPYHAPMTLSGIAFDAAGTAYVSTLVGDVWKVTGLTGDLHRVEWKRFASGLDLPLGIEVVDGVPYVNTRRNILRLIDRNGDGEADFIERFNHMDLPTADATGHDLRRDAAGNFYFNALSGIYRLSPDGATLKKVGHSSRNPFGLAVRADGLVLSDSSEGENNGTCTIYESDHAGNEKSAAKLRRIHYLPRGVDNSPGSRIFLNEPRMGPVGNDLLGVSFGYGTWYYLLGDVAEGTSQAALVPMPGEFSSGACRLALNPLDGQLLVAGLDGWGDYGVTEGCLHRIRYTGRDVTRVSGWQACRNGIELRFNHAIAADSLSKDAFFAQQWNVVDSRQTYGSPEYSVLHPEEIGHDRLEIRSLSVLPDRHSVFLEIPELLPAMSTQIHGELKGADNKIVRIDLYATINRLHPDSSAAATAPPGKPDILRVPEKPANGNTAQQLIEHFDKLAGRISEQRPVAPETSPPANPVTYRWLKENLIEKQCVPCHMTGTQHDLTTYQGMLTKINLAEPARSAFVGMIGTQSMPPYPLPTVGPGMRQAVLDWIKAGAPE